MRNTPLPADADFKNILINKPSAIGDIVHTLPILNLVRRRWPKARISWLVTPACAGLIQGHPMLDEVIIFDRKRLGALWKRPWMLFELRRFTRSLRERRFDLVLDLQGLFRSGWLTRRTGAPTRVGFANARELAWLFYTHRVPIEHLEQHAIERYLKLARFIGCAEGPVEFPFATSDDDRRHVEQLLRTSSVGSSRFAVLLPGTNWPTKRWPADRFGALVHPLKARFGLETVVAGGPDAAALADQLPGAADLTCKTTLRQLTALLERADLVIANDSGPMHIASALGRPLVTVYGPTNPVRTGPYGRMESVVQHEIACSPCYSRTCSHTSCMVQLGIDPVLAEAERQLGKPASIRIVGGSNARPGHVSD